jgi:signal transduction histidine kinase
MVEGPEPIAPARSEEARELMSTISHNLRTPLAVIKGCTEMLLSHGDETLDAARRHELLATTAANVERLADAISWLEEKLGAMDAAQTIRLPEPEGAPGTEAPPGHGPTR